MRILNAVKERMRLLTKTDIISFVLVLSIAGAAYLLTRYVPQAPIYFFAIAVSILLILLWFKAGMAVFDSLIEVAGTAGVVLSVTLFITMSYCDLDLSLQTAKGSLAALYSFGLLYAGFLFFRALWRKIHDDLNVFEKSNNGKRPLTMVVLYAVFIALFLWQFFEVLNPIVKNLCVYG